MGLILLRHPRPDAPPGLCYGRKDVAPGPDAPAEISAALPLIPPARTVLSSPMRRCRELAEAVAARDGCAVTADNRLLELDFGRWEGQPWEMIDRRESDPWAADPWSVPPPGGETFSALHARVTAVLATAEPGTILVCHAGPIRAAQMIVENRTFEDVFSQSIPYACPIALKALIKCHV